MTDLDSSNQDNRYKSSFAEYGESPQALKWRSYRAAAQRYRQLVADIDIERKTILDAGCGMGDLLPYLYTNANKFNYLGIDITPEFIEIAQKRYSGHTFQVGDPFDGSLHQNFDVIISCGVMNHNSPRWIEERKAMIAELFSHTNEALAFNMAGGMREASERKNIGYANLNEILVFCSSLTTKLILRNHYNPKDFTIIMFKQAVKDEPLDISHHTDS